MLKRSARFLFIFFFCVVDILLYLLAQTGGGDYFGEVEILHCPIFHGVEAHPQSDLNLPSPISQMRMSFPNQSITWSIMQTLTIISTVCGLSVNIYGSAEEISP